MTGSNNFNWAQELARKRLMAVDRPEITDDMPSLPGEVWRIIADMLAAENASSAIKHLNASCSYVHHATLPTLYGTVRFRSLEELEGAVTSGNKDRWRYVKIEGTSLFSRLLLPAVVNVTETPHRLQLTLFRPISLTTLLEVPNEWTSGIATDIVTLFGRNFYPSGLFEKKRCLGRPTTGENTCLIVRKGAYVSRPISTGKKTNTQAVQDPSWCDGFICIKDEVNTPGIQETLGMIFEYTGREDEPTDGNPGNRRSSIGLEFSSSFLDLLPEVSTSPPVDCFIHLSDLTTRKAMKDCIISLADAYSSHWTHRSVPGGVSGDFLEVEAEAPPEEFTLDGSQSFWARLSPGWYDPDDFGDEPTHLYGFTASLWETRTGSSMVWDRAYPMNDVPIPASLRDRIREE